jgi:hypothetical protein
MKYENKLKYLYREFSLTKINEYAERIFRLSSNSFRISNIL